MKYRVSLMMVTLAAFIGFGCKGDGEGSYDRNKYGVVTVPEREAILRLIADANIDGRGFSDFVQSANTHPSVVETYFCVVALKHLGALTDDVARQAGEWLTRLRDADGWFGEGSGSGLGSVDVAYYAMLALEELGFELVPPKDLSVVERAAKETIARRSGNVAGEVLALERVLVVLGMWDRASSSEATVLRRLLEERTFLLRPGERPADAVVVATMPEATWFSVGAVEAAAATLKSVVQQTGRHPGPWIDAYLGLAELGRVELADTAKMFALLEGAGAPRSWSWVGGSEAYLLSRAGVGEAPKSWGVDSNWRPALANALLTRLAGVGGFGPPVALEPSRHFTALAVVLLQWLGADRELEEVTEIARRALCREPHVDPDDSPGGVMMRYRALKAVDAPCRHDFERAAAAGSEDGSLAVAAETGRWRNSVDCPSHDGGLLLGRLDMVLGTLALSPSTRDRHLRDCGAAELASLDGPSAPGGLWELGLVVTLRVMLGMPIEASSVNRYVDKFRVGGAFGDSEIGPDMTETCLALAVEIMVSSRQVVPPLCR